MRRTWAESEWVLPASTVSGHIDVSTLKKKHAQAILKAGLTHFVLYSLRHTCLSRWAGSIDSFKLKNIAGHGSIVTTQRYVHVNDEELFAAVAKARGGHKSGHSEQWGAKWKARRSGPNSVMGNELSGAGSRNRTNDHLITNQALYQLSYTGPLSDFSSINLFRHCQRTA